jgi:hypothetical protein
MIMRVPLLNLFEAGREFLAAVFYPRLRSLRSLSLGLLRIKTRRGFTWQKGYDTYPRQPAPSKGIINAWPLVDDGTAPLGL